MNAPIAHQRYTVRNGAARDFEASLRTVTAIGYVGVETAAFPDTTARASGRPFQDYGRVVFRWRCPCPSATSARLWWRRWTGRAGDGAASGPRL
jgi:hypothetical protein